MEIDSLRSDLAEAHHSGLLLHFVDRVYPSHVPVPLAPSRHILFFQYTPDSNLLLGEHRNDLEKVVFAVDEQAVVVAVRLLEGLHVQGLNAGVATLGRDEGLVEDLARLGLSAGPVAPLVQT